MDENQIGDIAVASAIEIHRYLGSGLLESVYQVVLACELANAGLDVQCEVPIPTEYHGVRFDEGFRTDIGIDEKVILELKSVEKVSAAHKKQLLTYLRLTDLRLGYLRNFGDALMKGGISRIINGQLS